MTIFSYIFSNRVRPIDLHTSTATANIFTIWSGDRERMKTISAYSTSSQSLYNFRPRQLRPPSGWGLHFGYEVSNDPGPLLNRCTMISEDNGEDDVEQQEGPPTFFLYVIFDREQLRALAVVQTNARLNSVVKLSNNSHHLGGYSIPGEYLSQ